MEKNRALVYDRLLGFICKQPSATYSIQQLAKAAPDMGFAGYGELLAAIAVMLQDGMIDFIRHPNVPEHDFGIYEPTGKGIKFILHEGGYTRQSQMEQYNRDNIKFTWYRHWIWFFCFVISLVFNFYFLFFKKS